MANKFWNRKQVRSGFEATVRKNLDKQGVEYGYESIKLKYVKSCCPNCGCKLSTGTYTPDFIVPRCSGVRLVVECKGRFTSSDRTKMQRVKRDNPSEDIRLLFQRDNRIRKGSNTYYSTWCIKNGFEYAIGDKIPETWLS